MTLRNELFAMRFFGIKIAPPRSIATIAHATNSDRRAAPWPDFVGNTIYEGDVIQHPVSGERGTVVYLAGQAEPVDAWRVDYGDRHLSRLCLQIGEKGRGVVVRALLNIQS